MIVNDIVLSALQMPLEDFSEMLNKVRDEKSIIEIFLCMHPTYHKW